MSAVVSFATLAAVLGALVWGRSARVELVVAVAGSLLCLASGAIPGAEAAGALRDLGPTLVFLAAMLVAAELARTAGIFEWLGGVLHRRARSSAGLVVAVVLIGASVTVTLGLDATAVLFTPVVAGMPLAPDLSDRTLLATVQVANGGSLLLPPSNLTNLLVLPATGLTVAGFAGRLAFPALAVLVVITTAAVRGLGRAPVAVTSDAPRPARPLERRGRATLLGLAGLLVSIIAGSSAGLDPAWAAATTVGVMVVVALRQRMCSVRQVMRASGPGFLAFVAGLTIIVGAASRAGLRDAVRPLVPGGAGLAALLGVALLAAVLANLVNNLPATLLLLRVLPGGAVAPLLALLIGVNVGPNLGYPGSLATLLWRREVRRAGADPGPGRFHRLGLATTPVAIVVATVALWLSLGRPG